MKTGRVCVVLAGRHAGKKAIIVRHHDDSSKKVSILPPLRAISNSFSPFSSRRTRNSLTLWSLVLRGIHWKWQRGWTAKEFKKEQVWSPSSSLWTTTICCPLDIWSRVRSTWKESFLKKKWQTQSPRRPWRKRSRSISRRSKSFVQFLIFSPRYRSPIGSKAEKEKSHAGFFFKKLRFWACFYSS